MNEFHSLLYHSTYLLKKKQTIYGYGNIIEHEGRMATDPDRAKGQDYATINIRTFLVFCSKNFGWKTYIGHRNPSAFLSYFKQNWIFNATHENVYIYLLSSEWKWNALWCCVIRETKISVNLLVFRWGLPALIPYRITSTKAGLYIFKDDITFEKQAKCVRENVII